MESQSGWVGVSEQSAFTFAQCATGYVPKCRVIQPCFMNEYYKVFIEQFDAPVIIELWEENIYSTVNGSESKRRSNTGTLTVSK